VPLFIPRGQVKPRGIPRIDWKHPLAVGLVFYGFDTGEGEIIDLVSYRKATYSSGRPPVRPSRFGNGFQWTSSQQSSFPQDGRIQKAEVDGSTQAFAYACGCMKTSTAGNFNSLFGRIANNGASQPFWNFDFEFNASNAGQNTVRASANNVGTQSSPTNWTGLTDNVYVTLLNNCFSAVQHFYAQAKLIATNGAVSGQVNTNADMIISGAGFTYWGAMWNRPIIDAQITQLHVDPYSFLIFPGADIPILRSPAIVSPKRNYAVSVIS
jgi:hypothetical protein